jgi:hypothetical protein
MHKRGRDQEVTRPQTCPGEERNTNQYRHYFEFIAQRCQCHEAALNLQLHIVYVVFNHLKREESKALVWGRSLGFMAGYIEIKIIKHDKHIENTSHMQFLDLKF